MKVESSRLETALLPLLIEQKKRLILEETTPFHVGPL